MILLIVFAAMNPLRLFPDSTEVTIRNGITDASITSVFYLAAGSATLADAGLGNPVPPGEEAVLTFPCRYINRVIVETDARGNYRRVGFAPSPAGDTLSISRADREFGGVFDVVLGSRPFPVRSALPVPITGVHILDDGLPTGSVIGTNPLMTDETLFLWMDCDSIAITAVDVEGNHSRPVPLANPGGGDTLFTIGVADFLDDPGERAAGALRVISALNGETVTAIEVHPVTGGPLFVDLSAAPLRLWRGVSIPFPGEVGYVVGIDGSGRTFSVDESDPATGAFIIDWWHLDFDFDFPERRR
mgnify:FL=1